MKIFKSAGRMTALFLHYFRFNLSAGMAYKVSFITQVLGMILNDACFILFWLILFTRVGKDINGYLFRDVMFLWSLTACGFGLAMVFAGNNPHISRIIYSGELDVYLLQPKPILPNLLGARMSVSGWGDLLYGLTLFLFTQQLTPVNVLLYILFTLLLALLFISLRVFYHSLTFFLGNSEDFAQLVTEMSINFGLYPGSIFKGPVVWLLHTLLPTAFMVYLPVRIFRNFDLRLLLFVLLGDLVIMLVACAAFYLGLRAYESGNRMGTRM